MTPKTVIQSIYLLLTSLSVLHAQATHYIPLNPKQSHRDQFNRTALVDYVRTNLQPRQPRQIRTQPNSQCHFDSKDAECMPSFENVARYASVESTSRCGKSKLQRLCRSDGTCQICHENSADPSRFTVSRLTDTHQPGNQTCWASAFARPGGPEQAVNLTLSLGKRFEVYYISLQPCSTGSLPDSIALYKSSDFGRTWKPWHYFSTDCYRAFGLPTTNEHNTHISTANLQEVLCVALEPLSKQMRRRRSMHRFAMRNSKLLHSRVDGNRETQEQPDAPISFSTTLGRPAIQPWSPALIDWMTMTDIQITLMRFPNSDDYRTKRTVQATTIHDPLSLRWPPQSSSDYYQYETTMHQRRRPKSGSAYRGARRLRTNFDDLTLPSLPKVNSTHQLALNHSQHDEKSTVVQMGPFSSIVSTSVDMEPDVLSETEFYALADLSIGGRCKCNGHARECIVGRDGKLTCACEHNTDGVDCERCKSGHMDRPWERATSKDAKACTQCDCNLHSDECRFSNALYLMSNRVSGGVCENCQHNTAGRNCQHCAEGHYRDWTKPINHEQVCLSCHCHPFGSIIRHDCDRRSGQCRCKQGVTGLTCDRCQEGYHQTRSRTNPCTKVFQATFRSREIHGTMARFEMHVTQIWRLNRLTLNTPNGPYWPSKNTYDRQRRGVRNEFNDPPANSEGPVVPVWVKLNDLRCKCPEMELGISYLIVADFESYSTQNRLELLFTPRTALLPWRPTWRRRLMRFKRKQSRGSCDRYKDSARLQQTNSPVRSVRKVPHYQSWYRNAPIQDNSRTYAANPVMRTAYRKNHSPYRQSWSYVP